MKSEFDLVRLSDKIFISAALGMGVLILLTYLTGLSIYVISTSHQQEKIIRSSFENVRENITVAVYNNRITQAFEMDQLPELKDFELFLKVNDVEAAASVRGCETMGPDEVRFRLNLLPGLYFEECVFVKQFRPFVKEGVILGFILAIFSLAISCGAWFLFRGRFKKKQLDPLVTSLELEARDAAVGKMASQLAHDIRSPLAALTIFLKDSKKLPEDQKLLVRSAVSRIQDIANNLLPKKSWHSSLDPMLSAEVELLPSAIDRLVSEKRLQYKHQLNAEIGLKLDRDSYDAFAKLPTQEFLRVVSNVIDNSVEALGVLSGRVVVVIQAKKNRVDVTVIDNGKGIPAEILPKLMTRGATFGKESGQGLGLYHAKSFMERIGGSIKVFSEIGRGTKVRLSVPRVEAPKWFLNSLDIFSKRHVVVIDDDLSIHQTWSTRFLEEGQIVKRGIKLHRLSSLKEGDQFLSRHSGIKDVLFLVDHEFINSEISGLEWIVQNKLADSAVLVTSHFDEKDVREGCLSQGVKMIPKTLSPFVPIEQAASSELSEESTWVKALS